MMYVTWSKDLKQYTKEAMQIVSSIPNHRDLDGLDIVLKEAHGLGMDIKVDYDKYAFMKFGYYINNEFIMVDSATNVISLHSIMGKSIYVESEINHELSINKYWCDGNYEELLFRLECRGVNFKRTHDHPYIDSTGTHIPDDDYVELGITEFKKK